MPTSPSRRRAAATWSNRTWQGNNRSRNAGIIAEDAGIIAEDRIRRGRYGIGAGYAVPSRRGILRRFFGTVSLDPARVGRDAGRIAEEVIAHLAGQVGAEVRVTLEIEATLPNGASDQMVRTVTENSRTLKFSSQGFERD